MQRLVREIIASPLAERLHGWTSMHDLCVCETPDWKQQFRGGPYVPYLRIAPAPGERLYFIDFREQRREYFGGDPKDFAYCEVPGEEGMTELMRFLEARSWAGERLAP